MRSYSLFLVLAVAALGCASPQVAEDRPMEVASMKVQYLEIVTPDVDAMCTLYAAANGLEFGAPVAPLGNARTAELPTGGMIGIRAPMHEMETPVVRPYWLVEDIEAAVAAAVASGAKLAHPPLLIPEHGTFAVYIHGGIQHGLWQN